MSLFAVLLGKVSALGSDLLELDAHRRVYTGVELADRLDVVVPADLLFRETFHCLRQCALLARRLDRRQAEASRVRLREVHGVDLRSQKRNLALVAHRAFNIINHLELVTRVFI